MIDTEPMVVVSAEVSKVAAPPMLSDVPGLLADRRGACAPGALLTSVTTTPCQICPAPPRRRCDTRHGRAAVAHGEGGAIAAAPLWRAMSRSMPLAADSTTVGALMLPPGTVAIGDRAGPVRQGHEWSP